MASLILFTEPRHLSLNPVRDLAEDTADYIGALPQDQDVDQVAAEILKQLDYAPVGRDELIRALQVSPGVLTLALIDLELAGCVQRLPGNMVLKLEESLVA